MQDYNRAIIVGSNSTFGKGTVQRFYDLDRGISGYDEFKPLGAVKMTTQKFYRINGGSTQLKGVVPDIILPDTYHYIKTGEKDYDQMKQVMFDAWNNPEFYDDPKYGLEIMKNLDTMEWNDELKSVIKM